MSSESIPGREFVVKRPRQPIVKQWTFLEELILFQLVRAQFLNTDIDIATTNVQFQLFEHLAS